MRFFWRSITDVESCWLFGKVKSLSINSRDREDRISLFFVYYFLLQVDKGESLLIVGPSGAGKTSILRSIAGLWISGAGSITRSSSLLFSPFYILSISRSYRLLESVHAFLTWFNWAHLFLFVWQHSSLTMAHSHNAQAADLPNRPMTMRLWVSTL